MDIESFIKKELSTPLKGTMTLTLHGAGEDVPKDVDGYAIVPVFNSFFLIIPNAKFDYQISTYVGCMDTKKMNHAKTLEGAMRFVLDKFKNNTTFSKLPKANIFDYIFVERI
jgi:hypothetical protein